MRRPTAMIPETNDIGSAKEGRLSQLKPRVKTRS
jgi:hypothetical protein